MTRSQQQRRYDIDYVRQAARGQWIGILSHIGNISADLLDSRHHPCPKPECSAKTDGFRAFDDVAETGGVICNQCFNRDNNDGWKTLQWLTGKKFGELLPEVADHLGIRPDVSSNGKAGGKPSAKADPSEKLEWQPWNDLLVSTWCISKPPITPDAVQRIGGRLARYSGRYTVIAVPIWGELLDQADPVGWALYNVTGGPLPVWPKKGSSDEIRWVKIKTTFGSSSGLIGQVAKLRDATHVWKLEGPSDVLAFETLANIPSNVVAITNSSGAGEKPDPWVVELVAGKTVYVCHDADQPGQNGALGYMDRDKWRKGWCGYLHQAAKQVFNVRLPFEVSPDHGKDLRDFINERAAAT